MHKTFLLLFLLFFLNNCGPAGTVFIGPSVTAATTGNITRTTLSFVSNKTISELKEEYQRKLDEAKKFDSNKNFKNLINEYEKKSQEIKLLAKKSFNEPIFKMDETANGIDISTPKKIEQNTFNSFLNNYILGEKFKTNSYNGTSG